MSDAAAPRARPSPDQVWLRWAVSLLLVLALHAAALLTLRRSVPALGIAAPEPIMVELAPEPTSPAQPSAPAPADPAPAPPDPAPPDPAPPTPAPPTPAPPTSGPPPEPAPQPVPDPAPVAPDAVVPLPPAAAPQRPQHPTPPPPIAHPSIAHPPVTHPPVTHPPVTAPTTAASATAPAPATAAAAASAPPAQAQASWEGELVAHLARFRQFPPAAQRRGEQGVVLMRLTMAHNGAVLSMAMVRGSGYADLDEAAKAWMNRAQPLPAAPPEIKAQQVELVVPLRFTLR